MLPLQAKDLLLRLFTTDQQARLTANQVLAHKWMADADANSDSKLGEPIRRHSFNARWADV